MILFGDGTRLGVVLGNRLVFVAQVHLDDFFHVLAQLRELFLHLVGLGPDAAVDVALFVIGQVHQAGEILAEPDRVKNGEAEFSRRRGREQAKDDVIDGGHRRFAAAFGCFKKDRAFARVGQQKRK